MRNKELKEIVIKLKNPFPKDMYLIIFDNGSVIAEGGKKSFEKSLGNYYAILEPKWSKVIVEAFNIIGSIYIPDIDALKTWASEEVLSEKEITEFYTRVEEESLLEMSALDKVDYFDHITEWSLFIDDPEFIPTIFDEKGIYQIPIADDNIIRIGKQALPLITAKNCDKLFYHVTKDSELNLFELDVKFYFTHFQLCLIYHAIPMHK
nr:MAG TPA: hypothetical protein [Caudoviricetes sp.]